jgi:hypothetical protein
MKTAKQQAQELDQTNIFLTSLLTTDRKDEKVPPSYGESTSSRQVNGKPKALKIDPVSRFSEPPAPPPQQPLPRKPDLSRHSPSETNLISSFKRSETARPGSGMGGSPTNQQSSQILSLVEALTSAKKELDSQGARVKHLEDMLRQERSARESAEERARRLEQTASFKPITTADNGSPEPRQPKSLSDDNSLENVTTLTTKNLESGEATSSEGAVLHEKILQSRIEQMNAEMDKMKQEMQKFQHRAQEAEANATRTRASLADMIGRLRKENEAAAEEAEREVVENDTTSYLADIPKESTSGINNSSSEAHFVNQHSAMPNGHLRTPSKLPENLERAMATVLRTDADGQLLAQSAPYASMLGVVLLGVGLMAYLNSWQKIEK